MEQKSCDEVREVLALIGEKWSLLTLFELRDGSVRFNELRRMLSPITQRMLSASLRNLESGGLVTRTVYPTVPPQVEYAATTAGKDLLAIVGQVEGWVATYRT
ncbi:helix-turn-helix transcriptional regulator [Kribbella sp. NBC_01505]|uniref:winged helix-turn-helix transcriptional regulator n=1 Tax=Kribbella sp. NBC_01505 TaxID=2903580 RepID=UPI0038671A9A